MAVTPASFVLRYPEWEQVNTAHPTIVTTAISQGEDAVSEESAGDQYDELVMLAASSWLFESPYARDMEEPNDGSVNNYKTRFNRLMRLKGSKERTLWGGSDFDGY